MFYDGHFENGAFNGLGSLKVKGYFTYTGNFKNNEPHGYG
jgi:hypothetical protein